MRFMLHVRGVASALSLAVVACAALSGCDRLTGYQDDGGIIEDASTPVDDMGAASGDMAFVLDITPKNPVLVLHAGQTINSLKFIATANGQKINATWATDRAELGNLDTLGVYTPTGTLGGTAIVQATVDGVMATTNITVLYTLVENGDPACPFTGTIGAGGYGGVGGNGPGCAATAAQVNTLHGPPTADSTVKWLYPYDATVFPRGLLAPLLMWDPGAHSFDSIRVQMTAPTFSYDGTFAAPVGSPFINIPIPQATWSAMNYSAAGYDVAVKITFGEGANAVGPIQIKLGMAAATLKGIVYYNSYGTALVNNSGENDASNPPSHFGAGTLGIRPGQTDPVLVAGSNSEDFSGCRVCHTVSKDGSHLITQRGDQYNTSRLYDLNNGNAETGFSQLDSAFTALSPDGKVALTSVGSTSSGCGSFSDLYTLPTGDQIVSTPGLAQDFGGAFLTFSPDGKNIAFNWYAGTGSDQRTLATQTYDESTNTFGPIVPLLTPASNHPAVWPSYVPTNSGIVFETELMTNTLGETRYGNQGQLWWVDTASKMSHRMDRANGVGYLPTSTLHTDDTVLNYEPTVNPVPSGGYAWVVFTSRRLYGNVATIDPFTSDPRLYDWKNNITTKKLWVTAFDLSGAPDTDPSHPAFYLPAQELHAGNARGFWTTAPCLANGQGCESGDECCGGYCTQISGGADLSGAFQCTSVKPTCSSEFNKCVTASDCCKPGTPGNPVSGGSDLECINGYCATPQAPIL